MNCELIEWLRQHPTFDHLFNLIKKSKKKKTAWNWTIIMWLKRFMLKVEKELIF